MSDLDATEALDDTAATRAMQRTTVGPSPTRVRDAPPAPAPVQAARTRRDERAAAQRAARRRRWGSFLALLAAIAAIAIVAIVLLSSSDGGGGVDSVDTGDVQQQIDGLRDFIGEHSR
jgi:ferric-dicitrate binding protein FerR (iron transport regulator)